MKENGNFEFFIKWLAKYDESLSEHLSTAAKNARYLSPQIQNKMINCLGESIRNALVTDIRKSKFISVMADVSSDVSMTEQLAVCIRYLNASSDDKVSVNEVFLGFVELPTTDASTITDSLLGNLSKWGLDTERLRGMGFDGASNMSGTQSGVQARITQRYPKARDRVNAEIVHFYAEKIQKMHFQNVNASWDAGRLFVLDHLNKTKQNLAKWKYRGRHIGMSRAGDWRRF